MAKVIYYLLSILFLVVLFSCKKEAIVPNVPIPTPVPAPDTIATTVYDVSYGNHDLQTYDYYLPGNFTTNTPLLILIHGGGWESGDKSEIRNYQFLVSDSLPSYAVININYRLCEVGSPIIEEQVQDMLDAIAHFETQHPEWEGKKVGLGYSAGGHLLADMAFKNNEANFDGIILIAGHVDFTIPQYQTTPTSSNYLRNVFGNVTYAQNPTLWWEKSPIGYVNAEAPSVLLFYFGIDNLVPSIQGQRLYNALQTAGVQSYLTRYPNENHFSWTDETTQDMNVKIFAFLNTFY